MRDELRRALALIPEPGTDLATQRAAVWEFCQERDGPCWQCGMGGVSYLHEAVYTRGDVQGWARENRVLIHVPFCAVILCHRCHNTHLEPDRLTVAHWMLDRYGQPWLQWARGLPFKLNPLRVWLARQEAT